jgi:hypothetical protein
MLAAAKLAAELEGAIVCQDGLYAGSGWDKKGRPSKGFVERATGAAGRPTGSTKWDGDIYFD